MAHIGSILGQRLRRWTRIEPVCADINHIPSCGMSSVFFITIDQEEMIQIPSTRVLFLSSVNGISQLSVCFSNAGRFWLYPPAATID